MIFGAIFKSLKLPFSGQLDGRSKLILLYLMDNIKSERFLETLKELGLEKSQRLLYLFGGVDGKKEKVLFSFSEGLTPERAEEVLDWLEHQSEPEVRTILELTDGED